MRSILTATALIGVALVFVSCRDDERDNEGSRYGHNPYVQYTPPPTPPEVTPQPTVDVFVAPSPTPTTEVAKDHPYATPVAGKQGFVVSPHAPYSGYVDVRGYPPGMEVKCPYTGKVFLVP